MKSKKCCIAIYGPTASGKSETAITLSKSINGEIVVCDSVQLYKDFNIGSATPTIKEQQDIPHHMINSLNFDQEHDAACYKKNAEKIIQDIFQRNKIPIIVVGTGLYFRALFQQNFHLLPSDNNLRKDLRKKSNTDLYKELSQVDPERAKQIHENDKYRLTRALEIFYLTKKPFKELTKQQSDKQQSLISIFIHPERSILHARIEKRCHQMLENGWLEETKYLLSKGCTSTHKPMQSIGYKQIAEGIQNQKNIQEIEKNIIYATRQYAKRQITWFKKLSADYTISTPGEILKYIDKIKNSLIQD